MKKGLLLFTVTILYFLPVYSQTGAERLSIPAVDLHHVPDSAFEKGIISIKFRKGVEKLIQQAAARTAGTTVFFNHPLLDSLGKIYKFHSVNPAFSSLSRDTKRVANYNSLGLDRWFHLQFPIGADIRKIIADFNSLKDLVEIVEPVYKKVLVDNASKETLIYLPNDTRLGEQWHYSNSGLNGGTVGDDIHLPAAWDIEKGNANVIVAVIDQGIQITHPDLAQNIWSGIGYNFVNNNNIIEPGIHGTHTSGTVAAVNNNGLGVSGIAGGDGTIGSGVRLMSCEVFGPTASAISFGDAFIWAADNGAAIAQNSWGYNTPDVYEQSVFDAIDYFIANGGGTVMKGGIVIFAAGNNNKEGLYYPAAYHNVVSVAATNNNDVKARYSNYANWVSLSAPGGEQAGGNDPRGVLSTATGNGYAFLQGTSMACPHVSGVAALILSHCINRVSPDDIKSILVNTTDNLYPSNLPAYAGKLGTGRLNAFKALQKADQLATAPLVNPVTNFGLTINCPNIQAHWANNASGDSVLLAYSFDGNFGLPEGNYTVGDTISGGGKVIYTGNGNGFAQLLQQDSVPVYFKIWSVHQANYSLGLIAAIRTPYSIVDFTGTVAQKNIQLNWTRKCPNNEVLVAFNNSQGFGNPSGVLNAGDSLAGGGIILYKGPAAAFLHLTPIAGRNFYRIWPVLDSSYSYGKTISVCYGAINAPVNEGFESGVFPPAGWGLLNPDNDYSWERNVQGASSGLGSARINFWAYANIGQMDYLLSPTLDATGIIDSASLSFYRAYRKYDASAPAFNDTLLLQLSMDCGVSFPVTIWKKGGTDLVTNPAFTTANWFPAAGEWVNEKIDLKPFLPAGTKNFLLSFTGKNAFGQNMYIDDIQMSVVKHVALDAGISSIVSPNPHLCDPQVTPSVQFTNNGSDTITQLMLYVAVNKVLADSVPWTGILLPNQTLTQSFNTLSLNLPGSYLFSFYTSKPNGQEDQVNSNDTLIVNTSLQDKVSLPVHQNFESASFPPANWWVNASNSNYSWQRNTLAANTGTGSVWMRNYVYAGNGAYDELFTPVLQLSSADSVFLSFDLAHDNTVFSGKSPSGNDTLEILLTHDCGKTYQSVYKKWGTGLQTVPAGNSYQAGDTTGFYPINKFQWRTDSINLSTVAGSSGNFQLVFRNINNNGNNIFLDNINIRSITLPQKLKREGYLISPNPSTGIIQVQHYLAPTDLKGLQVLGSNGQLVWNKQYSGNAAANIQIDLRRFQNGIYTLKLIYVNKVIAQRIVKIQ